MKYLLNVLEIDVKPISQLSCVKELDFYMKKKQRFPIAKKSVPIIKKAEVSTGDYKNFITSLKEKIHLAQIKGTIAVNKELIKLYWDIGKDIVEKQDQEGWGSKILEKVAQDLQNEFPGVEGFSRRNMFRMKSFYQAYEKVPLMITLDMKMASQVLESFYVKPRTIFLLNTY